jgi:hypothetical protein
MSITLRSFKEQFSTLGGSLWTLEPSEQEISRKRLLNGH